MLRMLRHQLAAEFERILAGRMRQLIHEAFEIDRVVVDVHAAPEARRDVRIAHRMVDQQIGDGVAERGFARSALRPWNVDGIHAVDQRLRDAGKQDRLARRSAYAAPVRLLSASNAPVSLHWVTG